MSGREGLSLIVFSGDYDRVHYAFVIASSAAATGRRVTMFFTMTGIKALFGPDSDNTPGWQMLSCTDNSTTAGGWDDVYGRANIAQMEELIKACAEFDVSFKVCEMGLKAESIDMANLRKDLSINKGGMVAFLAEAEKSGRCILFI